MPIRDVQDVTIPVLVEVGVINKGAPKPENRAMPGKNLEHFRVTFRPDQGDLEDIFVHYYGQTPDRIEVLLPFDDIDHVFDCWYEAYHPQTQAQMYKSDGAFVSYQRHPNTGEVVVRNWQALPGYAGLEPEPDAEGRVAHTDTPKGWYTTRKGEDKSFSPEFNGRLYVMLPIFEPRVVCLKVRTGSFYDIKRLTAMLKGIEGVNGRLSGVPLVLGRRTERIRKKIKGKSLLVDESLLYIEQVTRHVVGVDGQVGPVVEKAPATKPVKQPAGEGGAAQPPLIPKAAPAGEIAPPAAHDDWNGYWTAAFTLGISQELAREILQDCEMDCIQAFEGLKQNAPPPLVAA